MHNADKRSPWRAAVDVGLYVLIGVLIYGGVIWFASYGPEVNQEFVGKWIGLTVNTPVLFGYTLRSHWRSRKRRWFWPASVCLLTLHVSLFSVAFHYVQDWKIIWFVFLVPPEGAAIDYIMMRFKEVDDSRRS